MAHRNRRFTMIYPLKVVVFHRDVSLPDSRGKIWWLQPGAFSKCPWRLDDGFGGTPMTKRKPPYINQAIPGSSCSGFGLCHREYMAICLDTWQKTLLFRWPKSYPSSTYSNSQLVCPVQIWLHPKKSVVQADGLLRAEDSMSTMSLL